MSRGTCAKMVLTQTRQILMKVKGTYMCIENRYFIYSVEYVTKHEFT